MNKIVNYEERLAQKVIENSVSLDEMFEYRQVKEDIMQTKSIPCNIDDADYQERYDLDLE